MPRPSNLLLLLKREAEYQRQRGGEEDSTQIAELFEWAAEEIEEQQTAITSCRAQCSRTSA